MKTMGTYYVYMHELAPLNSFSKSDRYRTGSILKWQALVFVGGGCGREDLIFFEMLLERTTNFGIINGKVSNKMLK